MENNQRQVRKSKGVKKKNWRDHFQNEVNTQGSQGLYLQGLRLRDGLKRS